jgi:hypothetical protein
MLFSRISIFLWLVVFDACQSSSDLGGKNTLPPTHDSFNLLLKKYVNENGQVDYHSFKAEEHALDLYLNELDNQAPDRNIWTHEEQLAYWINAYNAFTIKLILMNYPIKSIQELHPKLYLPLYNTVWHKAFFTIGGQKASLNEIEHRILRKDFSDPRIHFAINCASKSCPPLLNEAYRSRKIDEQLNKVSSNFINNENFNEITFDEIRISSIFKWFHDDFTKNQELISFLNQFSRTQISPQAKVSYMPYNWDLND